LSDAATDYKLLELQSVIWQMIETLWKKVLHSFSSWSIPTRGEKLFLGGLCLKMKEFQSFETSVALYQ